MATNIVNQAPFLRTSRNFPEDTTQLATEINKTYVDIANNVNTKTIGIFPTQRPAVTGDSYYLTSQRQQTLRQVYPFKGPVVAPIAHGIKFNEIAGFVRIYGTFTDGTNWYPLPYVAVVGGAVNQVNIFVDPSNIIITGGGGGAQPVIQSGFAILEWLSKINLLSQEK